MSGMLHTCSPPVADSLLRKTHRLCSGCDGAQFAALGVGGALVWLVLCWCGRCGWCVGVGVAGALVWSAWFASPVAHHFAIMIGVIVPEGILERRLGAAVVKVEPAQQVKDLPDPLTTLLHPQ